MRLIKLGIISIFGISIVITLMSLLIPSTARVSRAITIEAPIDSVRYRVQELDQWKSWNLLVQHDQQTDLTYTKGSVKSNEMEVRFLSADSGAIYTEWKQKDQEPVRSAFTITASGDATVLQWYFDFKVKWYPWEKFGSIIFDRQMGPPMERSLDKLRKQTLKLN